MQKCSPFFIKNLSKLRNNVKINDNLLALNYFLTYICLRNNTKTKAMKLEIGNKVNGSKGVGFITKIITKSSGYVEVDYNGVIKKEMSFNLFDDNGNCLKSKPQSQVKILTDEEKKTNSIFTAKKIALSVNNKWNQNTSWKLAEQIYGELDSKGNIFIQSLIDCMFEKNCLSENQAYHLAKFAVETNQF